MVKGKRKGQGRVAHECTQKYEHADVPRISGKRLKHMLAGNDDVPGMFAVRGVLTEAECAAWIHFAKKLGMTSTRPPGGKPKRFEAYRDNSRASIQDRHAARALWECGLGVVLRDVLEPMEDGRRAATLNDNIRLYCYSQGQRFGKHYDEHAHDSRGLRTEFTVLIYLSTCEGGATVFYDRLGDREVARMRPTAGMCLIHRHGDACLLHEAEPVTGDSPKWVLRTDIVYEKP